MFKRKAVLVKYPEPLTGPELQKIFKEQGKDSRIWQALDTIIDNMLLDAINDVGDPKNETTKYAHAAGRIDALSVLKSKIEAHK